MLTFSKGRFASREDASSGMESYEELGSFTEEDRKEHVLGKLMWNVVACNARCKAERARELAGRRVS